ncbi:hypothetical protein [Pseudomonas chlororaphis]|nr:hypothetical protein [Pseudomonas chlororaphis]AZD30240.1 hypothetical protein C4K23_3493 [Pseudomonas chlororaphis]QFS55643.1 hypothetical protein FD951_14185 [Pseudomonas chlororaphis subsp. aurantiaca]
MRRDIQSKLRLWSDGAGNAEVFVNSFLSSLGVYPPLTNVAPLGGPDGGRDLQSADGTLRVACYFPIKEYKSFKEIEAKFLSDMGKANQGGATQFVFVTGQLMQLADKEKLKVQSLIPKTAVYDCSDIVNVVSAPQAGFLRGLLGFPDNETGQCKPKFEGVLSSVDDYKELSNFIGANEEGIVFLNLTMDDSSFQGSIEEPNPYFVAYEECFEELEEGEKPSCYKCTGTEFSVHISHVLGSCFFYWQRGFFRLRGYFVITGYSGPYQGLMSCNLRGVRHEDIRM